MPRPPFSWPHLPPLVVATGLLFGGILPLLGPSHAASAIALYGLPARIASSLEAQTVMAIYGAKCVGLGLGTWVLYWQGDLHAVDTLTAVSGLTALLDGWACWREGVLGTAVFRITTGILVGGWGVLGITEGKK